MKIISVYNANKIFVANEKQLSIGILPDSTIFRNNDDFFIPSKDFSYNYAFGIVLKACKLGKHIPEKFAFRYFSEVGLGIHFFSNEHITHCLNNNIDSSIAYAFDKSLAISNTFIDKDIFLESPCVFEAKSMLGTNTYRINGIVEMIPSIISYSSKYFTLKIGDFIFIRISDIENILNNEEYLEMFFKSSLLLKCAVR